MKKTVLITGITGFLGRYVARHFRSENWRVVGTGSRCGEGPRDCNEYLEMRLPDVRLGDWLREESPDVCIHCAGKSSVPHSLTQPQEDFQNNVSLTFDLLDTLRRTNPKCRFILLSSAAVYGEPDGLPIKEAQRLRPLSPYGYHKRQAELICEEFARLHGMSTLSARIFSAYGSGLRRQVIWEICEQYLKRGNLLLKGTGEESRDFIHAKDVAQGLAILAERAPGLGEVYNLATGVETPISKVANLLADKLGQINLPVFDGSVRLGDPLHWRADIAAISALGFAPEIEIEQGLSETAEWVREQIFTPSGL